MRTSKHMFLFVAFLVGSATFSALGQRASDRPRASPNTSISQTIGVTELTISYGRPGVKGRKIWGELVPYSQVWRTGANDATTISVSKDVLVEGQKLPAGTYALFTIPEKEEWTIIFNQNPKQWGAFDRDPPLDVLRVWVKPQPAEHEEWMSFGFTDLTPTSATVVLRWEKLTVPFKIETASAPITSISALTTPPSTSLILPGPLPSRPPERRGRSV